MKFDILDALWAPRLVLSYGFGMIKDIGKKKDPRRIQLDMDEYPEERYYPRPQLVRDSFLSLDGEWDFSMESSAVFADKIMVPYPPEAKRSGIGHTVPDKIWYKRSFTLEKGFLKDRLLLHFGAVDQEATVYVNDTLAGIHKGGYLPFFFDITDLIHADSENTIIVEVLDNLDEKYPRGKQVIKSEGMWYTCVSGIWQSVWMESVAEEYISDIKYDWDDVSSTVKFRISGISALAGSSAKDMSGTLSIVNPDGALLGEYPISMGNCSVKLENPVLWSPDEPNLYSITIHTESDTVSSYFALRTISIEKIDARERICLNHEPVFFHGVLDQGYFSDGIFTPPSDRYYEKDILSMKELGINTIRKHIKLEPYIFYYLCDRHGMFVFQDMINNGVYSWFSQTFLPTFSGQTKDDSHFNVPKETKDMFISQSTEMIENLSFFPSVVYYTVFNEGWGQFESNRLTKLFKSIDSTRIFDSASGWFKQSYSDDNVSDVDSDHFYFHKIKPKKWLKPVIISECGGFARNIENHSFAPGKIYGYGSCDSVDTLTDRIVKMYEEEVIPNMANGICGTIYTQITDVEEEVNGLYTYDRAICKVDKKKMLALADKLMTSYKDNIRNC